MRALRQSSWHSAAPPRPRTPSVPTCSARFGAAARVVGLPARPRWRQCKLAPRAVPASVRKNAPSSMARAAPRRLAALLAARGGGTEALPTARAMEIGAQAAGRRAGRRRKGRSSRSWDGSRSWKRVRLERTRGLSCGNPAGIRPHRHARPCQRYPHVARGSARLLVWSVWPRARGGGNVNLRRGVAPNRPNSCRCAAVPQLLLIFVPF